MQWTGKLGWLSQLRQSGLCSRTFSKLGLISMQVPALLLSQYDNTPLHITSSGLCRYIYQGQTWWRAGEPKDILQ